VDPSIPNLPVSYLASLSLSCLIYDAYLITQDVKISIAVVVIIALSTLSIRMYRVPENNVGNG